MMGQDIGKDVMKVLVDQNGQKLAEKMFKQFVSAEDLSSLPSFVTALDRLLFGYRGDKPISDDDVEEFSEELEEELDVGEESSVLYESIASNLIDVSYKETAYKDEKDFIVELQKVLKPVNAKIKKIGNMKYKIDSDLSPKNIKKIDFRGIETDFDTALKLLMLEGRLNKGVYISGTLDLNTGNLDLQESKESAF